MHFTLLTIGLRFFIAAYRALDSRPGVGQGAICLPQI
jgi:hypothetical protein